MTSHLRLTLLWLFGGTIAYFFALQPGAIIDGHYSPIGPDSFYHATRILDAVRTGELYQFDSRIHAPEGTWIMKSKNKI